MFYILSEKDNDTCMYTFEELAALLARKKYLKIERKNNRLWQGIFPNKPCVTKYKKLHPLMNQSADTCSRIHCGCIKYQSTLLLKEEGLLI